MSNSKLEALRALLKKEKENKDNKGGNRRRNNMYPFWTMDVNKTAKVRLLPDKNEENPFLFYVEKLEHTLSIGGKDEKIPCLWMYGEKCPICQLSQSYYKAEGKESKNGKYYYRDKTSMVNLLVLEDPLPVDEETGESYAGKQLNSQFGFQLMECIKNALLPDPDEEESDEDFEPWSLTKGHDFFIKKTMQGQHANFAMASKFSKKSTPISEEYAEKIELIDLTSLLPKNPGLDFVKRKLDAHISGEIDEDDEAKSESDETETETEKTVKTEATKPKSELSKKSSIEEKDDDDDEEDGEIENILAEIKRRKG